MDWPTIAVLAGIMLAQAKIHHKIGVLETKVARLEKLINDNVV